MARLEHSQDIARFFFLTLLDQELAQEASQRVAVRLKQRAREVPGLVDEKSQVWLIHFCSKVFSEAYGKSSRSQAVMPAEGGWVWPPDLDLSGWKQFRKEAGPHELVAITWVHILGATESVVAEGLSITVGTVRHRLGHGLHKLGRGLRGFGKGSGQPLDFEKTEVQESANSPKTEPKRRLSRFLARELLYDYLVGDLNAARRDSLVEFLKQDESTREIYQAMVAGRDYAKSLSSIQATPLTLDQLLAADTPIRRLRKELDLGKLPDWWRTAAAGIGVSVTIVLMSVSLPWGRIQTWMTLPQDNQMEIARAERKVEVAGVEGTQNSVENRPVSPPPKVVATKPSEPPTAETTVKSVEEPVDSSRPLKGFVYRGALRAINVDDAAPQITEILRNLGGTKAGEVDLGWRRGRSAYYHFSISEEYYDTVLKSLQTFGEVRIYREPHRRVMPEGQIRFIMWVEPTE